MVNLTLEDEDISDAKTLYLTTCECSGIQYIVAMTKIKTMRLKMLFKMLFWRHLEVPLLYVIKQIISSLVFMA